MKVAVIGSRGLTVDDLSPFLPENVTEIVSGGARGIDRCARALAQSRQIALKEFLPDYRRYGRGAPLKRNGQIIDYADSVVALWDGKSRGTRQAINLCREKGKTVRVFQIAADDNAPSADLSDGVDQSAF